MPSFRRPLGIGKNEDGLKANESSVEDIFLITFEESGIYTVWKKKTATCSRDNNHILWKMVQKFYRIAVLRKCLKGYIFTEEGDTELL